MDLSSYAPESRHSARHGRPSRRPIDALVELHEYFSDAGHRSLTRLSLPAQRSLGFADGESRPSLNFLMKPAEFEQLARSLGWRPNMEAGCINSEFCLS